jgi:kynureninase
MHITDKVHVPLNVFSVVNNWGTCVATTSATDASATVRVLTNVQNETGGSVTASLTTKVVDAAGTVVLSADASHSVGAGAC